MKQKADHHLTFLAEKNDRSATNILKHLPSRHTSIAPSTSARNGELKRPATHASTTNGNGVGEEDAAGESDDAAGEVEDSNVDFRKGVKMDEDRLVDGNQLPECESWLHLRRGEGDKARYNWTKLISSPSRT
jgi:hypothetical protein